MATRYLFHHRVHEIRECRDASEKQRKAEELDDIFETIVVSGEVFTATAVSDLVSMLLDEIEIADDPQLREQLLSTAVTASSVASDGKPNLHTHRFERLRPELSEQEIGYVLIIFGFSGEIEMIQTIERYTVATSNFLRQTANEALTEIRHRNQ